MLAIERACLCLLILTACILAAAFASGGPLYSLGSLSDAFIWLNSAYFTEAGLPPNADFATPLGPLYAYTNLLAWHLTTTVTDLPLIVGLLFFLLIAGLLLFLRELLPPRSFLPLSLFFLLFLVSGRLLAGSPNAIFWYGHYNRICWSLLFVLPFVLLLNSRLISEPSDREKRRIMIAGGFICFLLLFIKFNFFIASFGLLAGWSLVALQKRDFAKILSFFVIAGVAVAASSLFFDLRAYVADLAEAATGRSSIRSLNSTDVAFAFAFIAGSCSIDLLEELSPIQRVRRLIVWMAMAAAVLVAAVGAFETPTFFLLLALCVRAIAMRGKLQAVLRKRLKLDSAVIIPAVIVAAFVALDSISLAITVAYKLSLLPANDLERIEWSQPSADGKKFSFLFASVDDTRVDNGRLKAAIDLAANRFVILAESESRGVFDGRKMNEYNEFYEIISDEPDKESILSEVAKREIFKLATNKLYVEYINDGLLLMEKHKLHRKKIFAFAYTNPFPALTGSSPPKGSPLWIHYEKNFSNPTYMHRALSEADAVMVPVVQMRRHPVPREFFDDYNVTTGNYCRTEITKFWELYEKRGAHGNCSEG